MLHLTFPQLKWHTAGYRWRVNQGLCTMYCQGPSCLSQYGNINRYRLVIGLDISLISPNNENIIQKRVLFTDVTETDGNSGSCFFKDRVSVLQDYHYSFLWCLPITTIGHHFIFVGLLSKWAISICQTCTPQVCACVVRY